MVYKYILFLMVILFCQSCSMSRELNGLYINHKRKIHGDLILINGKIGKVHSWSNDLWIDNKDFQVSQVEDTVVLNFIRNDYNNEFFIKKNHSIERIKEKNVDKRFKKISSKKAKKLIPQFVYQEIFDKK